MNGKCADTLFEAIAYKSGLRDSNLTTYDANMVNAPNCTPGGGGTQSVTKPMSLSASLGSASAPTPPNTTTTTFSVWDGDWAILEEYGPNNVRTEAYVQGLHGLVKTLVANVYYYQDELGSTSHIANSSGALLGSYRYNLYGTPVVYDATGALRSTGSAYNVRDLFTGQRWIPEVGLYDDRNRFMSPDQGRFLQPDPIGFKGDSSNLYRYCHNDWANKTDPMGLDSVLNQQNEFRQPDPQPWFQVWNDLFNSTGPGAGLSMAQMTAQTNEHGTAPQKQTSEEKTIRDYHALGNATAEKAQNQLQQNPQVPQYRAYIQQKNDGSNNFVVSPLEAGRRDIAKDQSHPKGFIENYNQIYNKHDPKQRDPAPPGYYTVAAVIAERRFVHGQVRADDRSSFHHAGLDGFVSYPPEPGTGARVIRFVNEGNVQ